MKRTWNNVLEFYCRRPRLRRPFHHKHILHGIAPSYSFPPIFLSASFEQSGPVQILPAPPRAHSSELEHPKKNFRRNSKPFAGCARKIRVCDRVPSFTPTLFVPPLFCAPSFLLIVVRKNCNSALGSKTRVSTRRLYARHARTEA